MGYKIKEDEKNERAIRGLLKLQENRRCINCNSLGPQYVCITFLTFICTNCSGIHREFTHRVKSISMSKFTAEEVSALQAGGNERARQIYFKEWDCQRRSYPDNSDRHRVRDFIKHVYLDRKYTGERSIDNLPRLKMRDKEEPSESRKISERRSPTGRSDDRSFRYYYDERRSPRYAPENTRSGGYRRSPARFEVVDDRFRDEGFGSGKQFDNRKISIDPRSMGDIIGVGESSNRNDRKDADGSPQSQKITSASGFASADGKQMQNKLEDPGSLFDLNTNTKPHDVAGPQQTKQMPPSNEGGNGALLAFPAKEKQAHAPKSNTLESLLFELSVPSVEPVGNASEVPSINDGPSTASGGNIPAWEMSLLSDSFTSPTATLVTNLPAQPFTGGSPRAASEKNIRGAIIKVPEGQKFPSMQKHQPSSIPDANSGYTAQQAAPPDTAPNNLPWASSLVPNAQVPSSAPSEKSSQAVLQQSQPLPVEIKSTGRQELPMDLFTASYSPYPRPVSHWQSAAPNAMGYNMQYHPNAMMPKLPHPARSANPFDLNGETTQVQAPMFPSMVSMQEEMSNVSAPRGLLHPSNLVNHSQGVMLPQTPSYHPTAGAYMGQQVPNNMLPSRPQGIGHIGNKVAMFRSSDTNQQPTYQDSFSSTGGNPFG